MKIKIKSVSNVNPYATHIGTDGSVPARDRLDPELEAIRKKEQEEKEKEKKAKETNKEEAEDTDEDSEDDLEEL